MSAAVITPGTRQKTMLEAKEILNFDAEVWQLPHNRPVSSIIGTGSKNGVLGGDKHNFITMIWGGGKPPPQTSPHCSPSSQSRRPGSSSGGGAHQRNAADVVFSADGADGADVVFTDTVVGHVSSH